MAVLTYADSPATRFSTARHHNPDDDPYDTLRASTGRSGSTGSGSPPSSRRPSRRPRPACALVAVDYEVRPAVTDPAAAMAAGAPLLHPDLAPGNVCARCTGRPAIADAGFAAADAVYEETFRTQRVQHVALETHCHDRLARRQ